MNPTAAPASATVSARPPTTAPPSSAAASPPAGSASAASPSTAAVVACAAGDVSLSAGPWGGAAGSRGSDITVKSRAAAACTLPPSAVIHVTDADGSVVLQNTATSGGTAPVLAPGTSAGFSVVWSNWCTRPAKLPLRFGLVLGSDVVEITGLSAATDDQLPPCNGPGQPANLATTPWQLR